MAASATPPTTRPRASIPIATSRCATRTASSRGGTRPGTDRPPMSEPAPSPHEDLPYRIELWHATRDEVERVLARAASAGLARAIFKAAQGEYPQRRITLTKGDA